MAASPVQRAICRLIDGSPLEELADDPTVQAIVGGPQACAAITGPARLVCLGAAVRCGKSTIVAAAAVCAAYEGDCSGLAPGEIPRVNIVSVDLDKAKETFAKLVGALTTSPHLAQLLMRPPTADSVIVRNRSGWPVEIKMLAGARAGNTLISRWCLGAIFDEAPRMLGQSDAVVNLDDALTALHARMRPGAQIFLVGSLWAPRGPVFELVGKRFGKPGPDVLVIIASGPQLRPELYTPEYCEAIRQVDDRTYESDVMSRFADPEDALLSSIDVAAACRTAGPPLAWVHTQNYVAVMDPATRGNGWSLLVMTCPTQGKYEIVLAREWVGSRSAPLRASTVLTEMAAELGYYQLSDVYTDQWGFDLLTDIAELAETGLSFSLLTRDDTVDGKELETLLGSHSLSMPEHAQLRADLIAVRRKARQQGGSQLVFPRTGDGRHCDFAAALLLAMQVRPDPPAAFVEPTRPDEQMALENLRGMREQPMNTALDRLLSPGFW